MGLSQKLLVLGDLKGWSKKRNLLFLSEVKAFNQKLLFLSDLKRLNQKLLCLSDVIEFSQKLLCFKWKKRGLFKNCYF